jgi:hypothetical protein
MTISGCGDTTIPYFQPIIIPDNKNIGPILLCDRKGAKPVKPLERNGPYS